MPDQPSLNIRFVLLDCPPSVGPITFNALTAADLLIIPTQCEYFSIQALQDMLDRQRHSGSEQTHDWAIACWLPCSTDVELSSTRMLAQMRDYFSEGLLQTIIGFQIPNYARLR